MDRDSATQLAERLNREHPERDTHMWFAREAGDEWFVAKAPLPAGVKRDPLGTTIGRPDSIDYLPNHPDTGGRGT